MLKFIRDLIRWFFLGAETSPPAQESDNSPTEKKVRKIPKTSSEIYAEIRQHVQKGDLLKDLRKLGEKPGSFPGAREKILAELHHLRPTNK